MPLLMVLCEVVINLNQQEHFIIECWAVQLVATGHMQSARGEVVALPVLDQGWGRAVQYGPGMSTQSSGVGGREGMDDTWVHSTAGRRPPARCREVGGLSTWHVGRGAT